VTATKQCDSTPKEKEHIQDCHTPTRKFNQQNHKPNTCIAAAHYQLKEEPTAVAVTLKGQLLDLKMANQTEICSVCIQKEKNINRSRT
jgi:hypothetical protein